MGNLGVPSLPPVTGSWHPSTWWESHDVPQDRAEPPGQQVPTGNAVVGAYPVGSSASPYG
ncbi:hypothetical protein IF650_05885 [Cellulosimicrobium terreum]|nr:hypothetical protein [Cellulosimicrobium terreum]